jgi:hypothetical protein
MAVINSSGVGARWGLRSRASASSWTDIVFRQCGLSYVAAPLTKSELYKATATGFPRCLDSSPRGAERAWAGGVGGGGRLRLSWANKAEHAPSPSPFQVWHKTVPNGHRIMSHDRLPGRLQWRIGWHIGRLVLAQCLVIQALGAGGAQGACPRAPGFGTASGPSRCRSHRRVRSRGKRMTPPTRNWGMVGSSARR